MPTSQKATIDDLAPVMLRNALVFELRSKGITQAELARRLHMKQPAVSRILKDPDRSRLATLRRFAKAAGIDLSRIL